MVVSPAETNALTKARSYVYDAVGNVTKITDRNGGIRDFAYDDLDRLTSETWKNGETTVDTIDFTYNDAGYLLTADDDDSDLTYTYDDLYRVLTEDNTGTSGVPDVVLTSGYDDVGNRTSLDAKIATTDDFQNDYTYDDIYRMTPRRSGRHQRAATLLPTNGSTWSTTRPINSPR